MKLIYHNPNNPAKTSPFDVALLKVADRANPLYLASPYIGIGFLIRLINNAQDWKLLTDVEAWLTSGNRKHRTKCWHFILENIDRIKHVTDLHAKVAIGNDLLFLGSANFTDKGILGRDELSVLIDDAKVVLESLDWFNSLWVTASAPVIFEGDELVKALDEFQWTMPKSRVKLSSSAIKVKSILATTSRPSGFDLASSFAKSSLADSYNLLSLEEAYQKVSDNWYSMNRTFTFKELIESVNVYQNKFTTNELWSLVVRETVNHWLGGLLIDGYDRYVYEDGQFEKWENTKLLSALRVDNILKFVINEIDKSPRATYLPHEEDWLKVGVPTHHILTIVDYLLSIGFLIEIDNPGEIEMYSIDSEFEWPKRWQKFTRSFKDFRDKQIPFKLNKDSAVSLEDDYEEEEYQDTSDYLDSLENKSFKKSTIKLDSINDELAETSTRLGITSEQLIRKRDQALTSFFKVIESKTENLTLKDIKLTNQELNVDFMPKKLLGFFADFKNGPFVRTKSLKGIKSRHSPNDQMILANELSCARYLKPYHQASLIWKKLISKAY